MSLSRREFLSRATGLISAVGIGALAGCSSSCPDSGRPTADETLPFDASKAGPFETLPGGTWPTATGDAGNTGYSPTDLPADGLTVRWRTQLDVPTEDGVGVEASGPVVDGERVYVADPDGVHALSLRSGELLWEQKPLSVTETERYGTYRPETIAPRIGPEGRVLVGLETGLVALDPQDGSVRWDGADLSAVAPPTVADDLIVAQGETELWAASADGTERWRRSVERGSTRRQPAATDEVVVVQTDTGLSGFDTATGDPRFTISKRAESAPVIADETCFVGTDAGLLGLHLEDGTEQFTYTRGDYMTFESLVVTPDTVYVVEQPPEAGASSFALERLDAGVTARWCSYIGDGMVTAATDNRALSLLSLAEGPGSERSLAGFSADRGAVPWAISGGRRSDTWLNPPAVLDGALVLTTRGGTTLAVSGGDGQ